mgnify:CR=1 FL=1|jgi:uncharacterized membrane protein
MHADLIPLILATLAFSGGHFLLSSAAVRGPIVSAIGEGIFRGLYSILMIAALLWMISAYNNAPYQRLWDVGIVGPPVILILVYFATIFFVCSVTTKNPTMVGMDALHHDVAPGKGIYSIVRHPMMAAIALWSAAHFFVRGDVAAIIFFGGLWTLATFGMVHIDNRRRANADNAWRAFEAGTSRTPFRAILEGRRSLVMSDVGWWRIIVGTVLYCLFLYLHENVFGMDLFPTWTN